MGKSERKVTVCMSLSAQTIHAIEQAAPKDLRGLSAKTGWLVQQWIASRDILVFYRTEEQKEVGVPDVLSPGAFRVMAWAPYLKGWDTVPEQIQDRLPKGFRLRANNAEEVMKLMNEAGYRTQLVQDKDADITEVWGVEAGKSPCELRCRFKAQLDRIREALK